MSIWHRTTPAAGGPPNNHVPVPAPPPPSRWRVWLLPIGIAFTALLLFHPGSNGTPTQNFSYTGFVNEVTTDKVSTAAISSTGSVSGQLQGGAPYTSQIPTALPSRDNPFAGRPYAKETQRSIDQEVARLLREADGTATKLLREHRDTLDRVIGLLLERETIDGSDLAAIVGMPVRHTDQERIWAPQAAAMTPTPAERNGISPTSTTGNAGAPSAPPQP